jgi:hypothetical protein
VVNSLIYIERKIRIKNNEAQIEEPIILYKGDMNIELQFIIENNPFKYKPGMDVTYGQLVIKRPNAAPIFSEPAKMSSSRVLFIITGDMIDESVELGDYDFQIRLLNTDQTSRGTLPPITAGITIKEPLCEEAITNRASVNDANAYVMRANNNVMRAGNSDNAFDADGNYNRTNWVGGDIITDTKLNKVEEALYQINNDIPTDYATEEYVDDSVRSTRDYVIDNYATTSYVDSAIEAIDVDVDLTGYATEEFVAESIRNSGHATESYVNSAVSSSQGQIEDYIANKYVSNSDIDNYATKDYVGEAIDNIEIPDTDLTGYATESYVDNAIANNKPNLEGLATEDYVTDYVEETLQDYPTHGDIKETVAEAVAANMPADIMEIYGVLTGDEFTLDDYKNNVQQAVLLNGINSNNSSNYSYGELAHITLGWEKSTSTRAITIDSILGHTETYLVQENGSLMLDKRTCFATQDYVDEAITNIEGGGSGSLDIMTIGNDDGSKYYFTGNEFTDEEYESGGGKSVLLNNVTINFINAENGKENVRVHNNELVYVDFCGPKLLVIRSLRGENGISDWSQYSIDKDGIITCTSHIEYATQDYVNNMLGDIDSILGGI